MKCSDVKLVPGCCPSFLSSLQMRLNECRLKTVLSCFQGDYCHTNSSTFCNKSVTLFIKKRIVYLLNACRRHIERLKLTSRSPCTSTHSHTQNPAMAQCKMKELNDGAGVSPGKLRHEGGLYPPLALIFQGFTNGESLML